MRRIPPWHGVPNWPDRVTGDEMLAAMNKVGAPSTHGDDRPGLGSTGKAISAGVVELARPLANAIRESLSK